MNSTKRDIHYTVQYTIMSVKYRKTNKTKINNTKILTSIALKGDGNSVIAAPTPVDESGPCTGNCPCGRPDNEENMIACGNSECNIGWYPGHFLIPYTGGAFAPVGPYHCPTTEGKKGPAAPVPWAL